MKNNTVLDESMTLQNSSNNMKQNEQTPFKAGLGP